MKKYLTVAAVLGAIAFVSVSYLAQANEPAAAPVAVEAAATVTTTTEVAPVAVDAAAEAVAKECDATVAASFEGKMPTAEEKAADRKSVV